MGKEVWSIGKLSIPVLRLQQVIIVAAVVLLYGYSVTFDYVLDDKIVITDNQFVKKGFSGIGDIMTTEGFEGFFGEKRELVIGSRYRPLSLVMFAAEFGLVGNNPWLGHLMNLLLYAGLGLILLGWARFTFREKIGLKWLSLPFLIALIFTLHPVHIEAVANIKGRDEILAMIFSMLTLWAGQKYVDKKSWSQVILTVLFFFLAMMSKENSVTFLAVVPMTLWLISRASPRSIFPIMTAMILAFAGYLALRYNAVGFIIPQAPSVTGDLMNNPFLEMEGTEKWSTITYTLGKYLQLLVFPNPLTHDYYPYHIPIVGWSNGFVIATVITYALLAVAAILNVKKRPWITWSVLFFVITLSIVSNVPFTVGTFMNERFLFMPSLAFAIALGFGIHYLLKGSATSLLGKVLLVVILGGYALKTATRVPDWKDGPTLNQSAIKVSRNSARINTFVATDYYNQSLATNDRSEKMRLLTEARKHLVRATKIYPLYLSANSMLSGVCAEFFKYDRDINALLDCFQEVATYRPDTEYLNQFLDYLKQNGDYLPELIRYYETTGYQRLYEERKNFPYAIRYLKEAERLNPGSKSIYEKLSAVYLAFGYHLQDYPDPKYKVSDIIESGRYYGNKAMGN